jgi:uncharacterized coiled-coil DUF342 family protein
VDRKAFIDKLTTQLREWDAEIDKLEAKAQKAKADVKVEYNQQVQELKQKRDAAQNRLAEAIKAGDEAWDELKSGADKAFDEMKFALEAAISRFK